MTDDSGIQSIDFLAGFTIFMVSFIWVATMVPGLFIGVQSYTIDYDAVAYRTGVILAEDPGAAGPLGVLGPQGVLPWELQPDPRDVARFGLAVSKQTPNILDENKVNQFFCSTAFSYPEDYQTRAIFGDYPYRFNISLTEEGENQIRSVGDVIPDEYGYIRRDVKIKSSSNATIDNTMIREFGYNNTENVSFNQFSIQINNTELLQGEITNPAYQINPMTSRIMINITDLKNTRSWYPLQAPGVSPGSNLSSINFYQISPGETSLSMWQPDSKYMNFTYDDNNSTAVTPPVDIRNNLSMIFAPGFFATVNPTATIYINLTFGMNPPQQFLNNTLTGPFDYNYNPANVTQPELNDAGFEVSVW